MKQFEFIVKLRGTVSVEDPKCPSYWRGSGCYNVDVSAWCDVEGMVNAESAERAKELIGEYDYVGLENVDEVEMVWFNLADEDCEGEEGVFDCSYGDVDGPEYMDGPDGDELYEGRRDREC